MATSPDVMRSAIVEHARRIDELEDKVSEARRVVVGVDKGLAVVASRLKAIERLLFAVILGVGTLVGSDLYHRLTELHP